MPRSRFPLAVDRVSPYLECADRERPGGGKMSDSIEEVTNLTAEIYRGAPG